MEGLSSPFKFLSNVQDFKLPTSCYVSPGAPMPFTTIAPLIRSSSLALDIRLRPLWPHTGRHIWCCRPVFGNRELRIQQNVWDDDYIPERRRCLCRWSFVCTVSFYDTTERHSSIFRTTIVMLAKLYPNKPHRISALSAFQVSDTRIFWKEYLMPFRWPFE